MSRHEQGITESTKRCCCRCYCRNCRRRSRRRLDPSAIIIKNIHESYGGDTRKYFQSSISKIARSVAADRTVTAVTATTAVGHGEILGSTFRPHCRRRDLLPPTRPAGKGRPPELYKSDYCRPHGTTLFLPVRHFVHHLRVRSVQADR